MYMYFISEEDIASLVVTHFPEGFLRNSFLSHVNLQRSSFVGIRGSNNTLSEFAWSLIFDCSPGIRPIDENISYITGAFSLGHCEEFLYTRSIRGDHEFLDGLFYSPSLVLEYVPSPSMGTPAIPEGLQGDNRYAWLQEFNYCYRGFFKDLVKYSGLEKVVSAGYPFSLGLLKTGLVLYTPILDENDPSTINMVRCLRTH